MAVQRPEGPLKLRLEFGGGMELLFSNERSHRISIPDTYKPSQVGSFPKITPQEELATEAAQPTDVHYLIHWTRHFLLADQERPDLFMQGDTVRPGILVLINSVDWELEGEEAYQLQPNDEVLFISTLHGG